MKPKFSKKLNVQLVAEVLKTFEIEDIVLSPGSRNGALATHFSHHPNFKTYTIVDERCAGFVALGMAQKKKKPVVICCTSGSASVNYYPAITEAFYQNVPLIILTADRPEHLVDNFDGQTIRQKNVFQNHSYHNTQLSEEESTESITENLIKFKKAIAACFHNSGPVHVNMPFSEPLYEFQESIDISFDEFKIPQKEEKNIDIDALVDVWNQTDKKLVLVGLHSKNKAFNELLAQLSQDESVVVLTETTSNVHDSAFINKIDQVIFNLNEDELEKLKPNILLTIGQNVVSKKIKSFIRKNKPNDHWHIDEFWQPDTFQCLTKKIECDAVTFLEKFLPKVNPLTSNYFLIWNEIRTQKEKNHQSFLSQTAFSDLKAFEKIIASFPKNHQIHYGNSTVIRYAQLFSHSDSNLIYCNRGTSGIDGSTSTAIGSAIKSEESTILVTGDISFFYDSNALWNAYTPKSFRIIILNNGGGNIFKFIPGPENSGVVDLVFETQHHLSASHLAEMFDYEYISVDDLESLDKELKSFYEVSDRPKIMEINTAKVENAEILREYFREV